jgi:DNA end-binding protein Ku
VARLIWKGSIRFGLVDIQVGLRPAERPDELHFTMLDRHDRSPIGYERINKTSGKKVAWEDIVRGYEHDSGEMVVLSDEDLESANVEATQTVEILGFVKQGEIDPMHYERPYYLEPVKKRSKSYALLREALRRSGRVGIGKVVLRTRQHLAAVSVRGPVLMLELLRYDHELLDAKNLGIPREQLDASVDEKELKMAERLIDGMTEKWDPSQYKDEYRDDLLALIDRRVEAGQLESVPPPPERKTSRGEVVDLLPLLKRSLEQRAEERGPRTSARSRPARGKRARPSRRAGASRPSRRSGASGR